MTLVVDIVTPYYLDAGTGSMLVQLAVAGVAGAAVFAKMFWSRMTAPFRRKPSAAGELQPSQAVPADD